MISGESKLAGSTGITAATPGLISASPFTYNEREVLIMLP